MKEYTKKNRILIALVLLGLLASLAPVVSRVRAEESNKYYDLVISYGSLQSMAVQSKYGEGEWLDMFRAWGVDKVALGESSVRSMSSNAAIPVYGGVVSEIRNSHGWELRYPDAVARWIAASDDLFDALVIVEDPAYAGWVRSAFEERMEKPVYEAYEEDGVSYYFFPRQESGLRGSDLLNLPLGIWPETVRLVQSHGMTVVPRTETVDKQNGERFAKAVLKVMEDYDAVYYLNAGDALIGYDDPAGKKLLKDYLTAHETPVGMFEQNDQSGNLGWDGFVALLEETGYHGVRLFNEWPYIQNRYAYCGYEGPEEITNSLFRAVAERNCKIVYLTMILEPDNDVSNDADKNAWTYITDPADYEKMLGDLDARLAKLGYVHGTVPPMELKAPSVLWRVLEGIGTVAAAVLLLDLFFFLGSRARCILLALGTLGVLGLAFAKPALFRVLLSMASGIVMPSLAAMWLCRHTARRRREEADAPFGKVLLDALASAAFAAVLSLGGALMATSALSQLSYMLEIDLYRGVKIMQLIPIGMFVLSYLLVYAYEDSGARAAVIAHIGERGEKGRGKRLRAYWSELMAQPMKLGWMVAIILVAVIGVFVLAAGVYYMYRTGNTTNVSARELRLRNILENLLIARPRTKEFLIGWPCTMLFVWALRRRMNFLPLLLGLGMSIGLVSVVNTFLHIRTPFLLSLLRTGWGLLFGLLIGAALTIVAELLLRLVKNARARANAQ